MRAGAWTAACLLLTAARCASGQAAANLALSADVSPVKSTHFEIPIRIDDGRRTDIQAIELHMSTDQGQSWRQVGNVVNLPANPTFTFNAPADGLYWFSIVVVDKKGRREPPNIYKAPVGMKVLVDTLKPEIKLKADRQGDAVLVRWEVREEFPDLNEFRLQWKPADAPETAWASVAVAPALEGQTSIRT